MTIKDFFSFRHNKCFWLNILAMVLVVAGGLFAVLQGLDRYTHHGEAVQVPDVRNLDVDEAQRIFRDKGLQCLVADSSYVKSRPAGCVLDYTPSAGQRVKAGRIIYLTINTRHIPLRQVPDVADNSSLRQAEARLLAAGFKLDSIEYMAGERDWVYGVKYQGRLLNIGDKVPMGAILTLMAGDGGEPVQEGDSLDASGDASHPQEAAPSGGGSSEADESWF